MESSSLSAEVSGKTPVSLLYSLIKNNTSNENSSFLKLVKQEVDISEIAEFEYRQGALNAAQCLYAWVINKLIECDKRASNDEVNRLILLEGERVDNALTTIEDEMEALRSNPSTSVSPSANRGFLTLPMAQFLAKFRGYKPEVGGLRSTNNGNQSVDSIQCENKQQGDTQDRRKGESTTAKFKPEIRLLVKSSSSKGIPTWDDIKGFEDIKRMIYQDYIIPRMQPEVLEESAKQSLILLGPPGNGKTLFAKALANSLNYPILQLTEADYTSSYIGESLIKLKACYEVALEIAPCILFLDEIESIAPDRFKTHSEHKKQEVNQLINILNDMELHNITNPHKEILFLAATNIPYEVDGAIWRRMDVRIHVQLPKENERRIILENCLGEQICSVMSPVDWKTFFLHTKGFASSDVMKLSKDIATVPRKISINSEYFRPLHSFKVPTVSQAKTATFPGFPTFESYTTGWIPCSKNHPQAVKKDYMKIMADVVHPAITVRHIIMCAKARPPSLNIYDENGPVALCAKFAATAAQEVGIIFSADDDDESFDSEVAYEEAKVIYQRMKNGEGDPESKLAKFKAPQRDVTRVTFHNGKMLPVEEVYEALEKKKKNK